MPATNMPVVLSVIAETPQINYTTGACIYPVITSKTPTVDPLTGYTHWREPTMPILKGFPPSNTISPTARIGPNDLADPVAARWQPPSDDWDWDYYGSRPKQKKHPKFTVEIFEEEQWQS